MAASPYIKNLRERIGHDLLLMPAVSAIIFNEQGHVLLHQSSDDARWYLIGGAMDPGENASDACVREVREETGLVVEPQRLVGVYTSPTVVYPNGDQVVYVGIAFRCRVTGGELRVADDESLDVRYFPLDQLPPLREDQRARIFHARENGGAFFVPPNA
jgi:8-oxo-dGTP diphosphatase